MKPITIGKLSSAADVKVTTIRYYESIGLMGEPDRSESGRRLYGSEAIQRTLGGWRTMVVHDLRQGIDRQSGLSFRLMPADDFGVSFRGLRL